MAAILRVKRRNSDEPLIALLVASKRQKTDDDSSDAKEAESESTTVLKFAGTVKDQEADVIGHLVSTLNKDELKANYKKHSVDILDKVRERKRQETIEKRYKVINCLRSLDASNYEHFEDKVATLIDVEDLVSCAAEKKADDEKKEDYVYDVYYANTDSNLYIDESVSVHPFHQEFIYDMHRNGEPSSESDSNSEDSNSESNWRNDYPDSDEDMRKAVMNLRVDDDENDDSSDDEDFVYACNQDDVDMYGYQYAKYKAKLKLNKTEEESSDESSHDYYRDFDLGDDNGYGDGYVDPETDEDYNNDVYVTWRGTLR